MFQLICLTIVIACMVGVTIFGAMTIRYSRQAIEYSEETATLLRSDRQEQSGEAR